MILITGGAGFIGSYLQGELAARGLETIIVDWLGSDGKWRNIARHPPTRIIAPEELDDFLSTNPNIEMVYHLGAISETTATDGDLVWRTNVELSRRPLGLVFGPEGSVDLCVLGRDLRGRITGVRR